jgi:ribosomal-protein-alanine N-acetyltransferase
VLPAIRSAASADLPRLIELQSQSPEAAQWSEAQYRGALEGAFGVRCLVAELSGQVEGMIVYRGPLAEQGEILNLAIAPGRRRRGLGRSLLGWLREHHPATWFLEVRAANHGAIDFYRRCGFAEVGRRKGYYRDPVEDALLMRCETVHEPGFDRS